MYKRQEAPLKNLILGQPHFIIVLPYFQVGRAEVKIATLLACHNIPIATASHLSPLFKDIFPNFSIAQNYASGRYVRECGYKNKFMETCEQ